MISVNYQKGLEERARIEPTHEGFRRIANTDWFQWWPETLLKAVQIAENRSKSENIRERLAP
jgi:hypothetical protein